MYLQNKCFLESMVKLNNFSIIENLAHYNLRNFNVTFNADYRKDPQDQVKPCNQNYEDSEGLVCKPWLILIFSDYF